MVANICGICSTVDGFIVPITVGKGKCGQHPICAACAEALAQWADSKIPSLTLGYGGKIVEPAPAGPAEATTTTPGTDPSDWGDIIARAMKGPYAPKRMKEAHCWDCYTGQPHKHSPEKSE